MVSTRIYREQALGDGPSAAAIAGCLAAAGVAIFPTETFYGLGGDPRQAAVITRIAALKGRPQGQAFPLIAADLATAGRWAALTDAAEERLWERLVAACWPGPLTLVVSARPGLARGAMADDGTLAMRVPGCPGARRLAALAGGLLVSTSANASGQPPAVTAAAAASGLAGEVDLVVDGGRVPGGQPSTLVAISGGVLKILRRGAVDEAALRGAAGATPG